MARILKHIDDYFLFIILLVSLYFVYLVFHPFLQTIVIATVFSLFFYPLHAKIFIWVKERPNLAAFITTLIVVLVILVPLSNFAVLLSKKSIDAYSVVQKNLNDGFIDQFAFHDKFTWAMELQQKYLYFIDIDALTIKKYILDISGKINVFLIESTAGLIKGTTQIITSFLLVMLTMFFLFRDGKKLLVRIMHITPLANRYDLEIFEQFRSISVSTLTSTFIIAIIQGIVGAIGFLFAGVPAFFFGIAMAVGSLIPVVGTMIVWLPSAIVLFAIGRYVDGLIILFWGALVVSSIDNLVKPLLITAKDQIHPLLVFFSILGGIVAFGPWGIIFGPVVLAVFLTILHIYETEYARVLGK